MTVIHNLFNYPVSEAENMNIGLAKDAVDQARCIIHQAARDSRSDGLPHYFPLEVDLDETRRIGDLFPEDSNLRGFLHWIEQYLLALAARDHEGRRNGLDEVDFEFLFGFWRDRSLAELVAKVSFYR
jgi:hypothetical protein